MNIEVNCIYNDEGCWCKNRAIKRSLWGLGARMCIDAGRLRATCEIREEYPKPASPPPPPPRK